MSRPSDNQIAQAVLYEGFGAKTFHGDLTADERIVKLEEEIESVPIGPRHVPFKFHEVVRFLVDRGIEEYGEMGSFGLQIQEAKVKKGGEYFHGHNMFGVATFRNPLDARLSTAVAWSLSNVQLKLLQVAHGNIVTLCANGIFDASGARTFRKNTKMGMSAFQEKTNELLLGSGERNQRLRDDLTVLEEKQCAWVTGAKAIGGARAMNLLRARQSEVALKEWNEVGSSLDAHDTRIESWQKEWADSRNMWRLHNAFTQALKTGAQDDYINSHARVHRFVKHVAQHWR